MNRRPIAALFALGLLSQALVSAPAGAATSGVVTVSGSVVATLELVVLPADVTVIADAPVVFALPDGGICTAWPVDLHVRSNEDYVVRAGASGDPVAVLDAAPLEAAACAWAGTVADRAAGGSAVAGGVPTSGRVHRVWVAAMGAAAGPDFWIEPAL
ncbi:MAG: hypothetical protein U0869_09605 [Chloroflexota bacterium]